MARLDTKNGKAEFVPKLQVKRNATYVVLLEPDGSERHRLKKPTTLESIAAILDGQGKSVAIKYPNVGKLTDDATIKISALAIAMLRTSSFNSAKDTEPFEGGVPQIHSRYRKSLSGSCLVVTFDLPRNFDTIGGEITAAEIVIGLNRDDYADTLFTTDIEGRVVEHAKYSGATATELLAAVKKQTTQDSEE